MKLFFLLFFAAYAGGNIYLFVRLMQLLSGVSWPLKAVVAILFWIVAFAMVIALFARNAGLPDVVMRMLYRVGSAWMVFTLYMVLALLVFDVVKIFVPSMRFGLLYAAGITISLLVFGYWNYRHPKVEHIDIELDKPVKEALTIVAVSDVHLGDGTDKKALMRYVKMINEQNPDVVLIGGDLIDNSLRPVINQNMAEVLSQLQAPQGVYMAAGNHEYISGIEAVKEYLATTSITLLQDSVVVLPSGVQIVGRDDLMNRRRASLSSLLERCDMSMPVVVIDHQPYHLQQVDDAGVDLQFSGHTHHGQVWPISLLTDHIFEQSHGYRKWQNTHIFVSSGLSLWGPPFRIGTKSDMAVFRLKSNSPQSNQ